MAFPPLLITGCIAVTIVEFAMWTLFRTKVQGLCLPHTVDASAFSFFTLFRMRIITILHTIFLIVCLLFGYAVIT